MSCVSVSQLEEIPECVLNCCQYCNLYTKLIHFYTSQFVIVYLSPECVVSSKWLTLMRTRVGDRVKLIAVDEAHCVTEWLEYGAISGSKIVRMYS